MQTADCPRAGPREQFFVRWADFWICANRPEKRYSVIATGVKRLIAMTLVLFSLAPWNALAWPICFPASLVPGSFPTVEPPDASFLSTEAPRTELHARAAWTNRWALYDHPRHLGGRRVATAVPGTESPILGCSNYQSKLPNHRLCRLLYAWNPSQGPPRRTVLWADIPINWIQGAPSLELALPNQRLDRPIPFSTGALLPSEDLAGRDLLACPDPICPIAYPVPPDASGDTVTVTGRAHLPDGTWLRVEHRQTIGWVQAAGLRPGIGPIDALALLLGEPFRYRTCTRMVIGAGWWGLCEADSRGRMADSFERDYDNLDPTARWR